MDGEMFFLLFNLFRFEFVPHTFLASGQACLRKLDSSVDIFLSNVKNRTIKETKIREKKSLCAFPIDPSYLLIHLIL